VSRPIAHLPKPQDWKYTTPEAKRTGHCARCGVSIWTQRFRDELSAKEYTISAMCQACQDGFYEEYPESATRPDLHDYGPKA
jgi:hypothetical protein